MVQLHRSLQARHLWGLAVGLVISGEYFGWNYGWSVAGTLGFLVATALVALLYTTLVFSFTELTTAIPDAGGPYAYCHRAFGPGGGFLAGFSATIEFLFAPPAIAYGLGKYLHRILPFMGVEQAAIAVIIIFGLLNLFPIKFSARFEFGITILAVLELLIFIGVAIPHFEWARFAQDGFVGGWQGILAGIPYAIWFFLAIEGVAMAAEETVNPERNIPLGYLTGIGTLILLALGVMLGAGGVGDWKKLSLLDDPLPEAIAMSLGQSNPWVRIFAVLGLFGLIASLNGILLSASRQIFAASRAGLLPVALSRLNRYGAPAQAVCFTTVFGVIAIFSGKTDQLIVLSALGAVSMYGMVMAALFRLRKSEPHLVRPFRAPLFPWFPAIAFVLSIVSLIAIVVYNFKLSLIFLSLLTASWLGFVLFSKEPEASLVED